MAPLAAVHRKRATHPAKRNGANLSSNANGAWELVHHSTEQNATAPSSELMAQINPLRDMADRVEREVDHFAETLDKFNHVLHDETAYDAAYDLAVEYKAFANDLVKRLTKRHEAQRLHEMRNEFGKRLAQTPALGSIRGNSIMRNSHGPDDRLAEHTSIETLRQWQTEADTWELFRIMLELRYNPQQEEIKQKGQARLAELGQPNRYTPDSVLWERFTLEIDLARERQLVLKWFQGTADHGERDMDVIAEELDKKTGRSSGGLWLNGWMETRERIKGAKRTRMLSSAASSAQMDIKRSDNSEPLVSELDPDAPTRQNRTLEKADAYSERSLWMTCYEMLRRGKSWAEICDWCSERNQSWRAVSVGASATPDHDLPLPGLSVGALWRRLCNELAARGGTDEYEAATYGLLSGHIESVKKVCKSWDDHFYAHYNSALLSAFDQYSQRNLPHRVTPSLSKKFRLLDKPPMSDKATSARDLVQDLQKHRSLVDEARKPMKLLQSSLLANTFEALLLNLSTAISDAAWYQSTSTVIAPLRKPTTPGSLLESVITEDCDTLRIVTHMLIMLRDVHLFFSSKSTSAEHLDNIIAAYVQFLNAAGKRDLAPLYASKMSPARARASLALVLSDVHDVQDKISFIKLMGIYGIDPVSVLVEQSQYLIRKITPNGTSGKTPLRMVEQSTEVVHPGQRIKLDFTSEATGGEGIADHLIVFYLVDGHWDVTFGTLAYACRKLLLQGCFLEASHLASRLPFETLSTTKSRAVLGKGVNVMDHEETHLLQGDEEKAATLRVLQKQSQAYYELTLLIRAVDALEVWRQMEHEHMSKMPPPTSAPSQLKKAFEEICASVDLVLTGILLSAKDETEASELAQIRTQFLPEIVIAYNTMLCAGAHLVSRDNLMRSMELASSVADGQNGLADAIMEAGRMREMVTSFARSSETTLKLNEIGKPRREKRHKTGGNLAVWEIGG